MNSDTIELGKKAAAERAVEENVQDDMILGIGSGSTVVYAIKKVAELGLNVECIPTSYQSRHLILKHGLKLGNLDEKPLDVDIDGADEIDKNLNLIKGGGGCLVQEKIIASNSKKFVVIGDFRKKSEFLGEKWTKGVPIEVLPLAQVPLMQKFRLLNGNPILRMAKEKFGPIVSDNGNFIVDVDFGKIKDPVSLNTKLLIIPGVVDTGLFIGMTSIAYIGKKDGTVKSFQG